MALSSLHPAQMLSLYKDPQGEKIFSGDSTTVSKSQFTASVTVVDSVAVNETRFSTIAAEAREWLWTHIIIVYQKIIQNQYNSTCFVQS